jgi:dienelactone hydrolase
MRTLLLTLAVVVVQVGLASAKVQTKTVTYTHDGTTCKGYLAWDDSATGKRPGVLLVHEWWGLNDYARSRAEQLAKLGYVAFACDMYGEGKVTTHPREAGQMAGAVRKNVKTWQGRALAGLKVLRDQEMVDPKRIAAIGYCFGGSTVLELAYSGADLSAVVSFHGALPVPSAEQAQAIRTPILICHGAADGFTSAETIAKMRSAFEKANVDYQMIYYAGAKHSFTVPTADKAGIEGIAYNAKADRRSWQHMQQLFAEVFGSGK